MYLISYFFLKSDISKIQKKKSVFSMDVLFNNLISSEIISFKNKTALRSIYLDNQANQHIFSR